MISQDSIDNYVWTVEYALEDAAESLNEIYDEILKAKTAGRTVWILGNGGSLAIAQHFAQDLVKLAGVRAQAINCPSLITAYSNDSGFEYSYFQPLDVVADKDDPILIFSCSGKSRNYIEFVSGFPDRRRKILSVVGTDGGFLKSKSDICVHIKSNDYQVCETAFCVVADILVKELLEDLK